MRCMTYIEQEKYNIYTPYMSYIMPPYMSYYPSTHRLHTGQYILRRMYFTIHPRAGQYIYSVISIYIYIYYTRRMFHSVMHDVQRRIWMWWTHLHGRWGNSTEIPTRPTILKFLIVQWLHNIQHHINISSFSDTRGNHINWEWQNSSIITIYCLMGDTRLLSST